MSKSKFRPLHDRVVVKRIDAEEKTKGGIIIPDSAKEKPSQGEITAVGGGIVRDVLAGQVPEVLRREMYALPALLGSALIVTAHHFDVLTPVIIWGCVALVFAVRMIAVVLDVHAPKPLRTGELT